MQFIELTGKAQKESSTVDIASPQLSLGRLVGPGGTRLGFSADKHVPRCTQHKFLGVLNDWRRAHVTGVALVGVGRHGLCGRAFSDFRGACGMVVAPVDVLSLGMVLGVEQN